MRKSPWFEIAGEDYIAEAFKAAHEADPEAELYYNDYNLDKPAKRAAAIALVKKLRAQGLRVDAHRRAGPLAARDADRSRRSRRSSTTSRPPASRW